MEYPTQEELNAINLKLYLSYNPNTGELIWIKKASYKTIVGSRAGWINKTLNRRYIAILGKTYCATHLIWLYMTGHLPSAGDVIDHINWDSTDDRWGNLRLANKSTNAMNRGLNRNNTSGYRGVYKHHTGNWTATVSRIRIAMVESKIDAAKIYNDWSSFIYGDFAYQNKI